MSLYEKGHMTDDMLCGFNERDIYDQSWLREMDLNHRSLAYETNEDNRTPLPRDIRLHTTYPIIHRV